MLLGKNQRSQMQRTTSTMRIPDLSARMKSAVGYDQGLSTSAPPRYCGVSNTGFSDRSDFLTTCGLCKGRLTEGRDIYMYRGNAAFCSEECREQQMKQDEKKEKYGVVLGKKKGQFA